MTELNRQIFSTSRLLDFVSEKELTLQCGFGRHDWPLVAVKELLDNALDACEEQDIAPEVTVTVDESAVTVADNGAGVSPGTVDALLDFSIRVSSREAYVAPDRGAQGNALKTIIAMPFVLDGEEGRVDIVGGGVQSEILFAVDRIAQRPVAEVSRFKKNGSSVTIHWPPVTSSGDDEWVPFLQNEPRLVDRAGQIRRVAEDFTFLNPHLMLTIDCFGETTTIEATDAAWSKWKPSSPTSPHWYEADHLERLLGAYITHDHQNDNPERTVREFISEFRGLTSTTKQKKLLADLGLARAPLSSLLINNGRDFDHDKVAKLLAAMKGAAKPPSPKALGTIGRAHVAARFEALGIRDGSLEYNQVASLGDDGLPQVTETCFAALSDEAASRRLVTGVNWSAMWVNPFRTLGGPGSSLDTILHDRRFEQHRPVALLLHVAEPRVDYADRGKSTVLAR